MRHTTIMVVVLTMAGLAGCAGSADRAVPAAATGDPRVVSHLGGSEIRIGDTRAELERTHGLVQDSGDCAPRLPEHPSLSPVFDDAGRLVLLWVHPPLRTPAGLTVGSPVEQVRQVHPDVAELPAPDQPYRFHGLLVTVDHPDAADHAYLFLHDRAAVQKLIVGHAEPARRLYHEQFGVC